MSLFPYAMREMMRSLRTLENQMRHAEDLFHFPASPFQLARTPRVALEYPEESNERITQDRDKFQVKLDLRDFKPENIAVKMIDENAIQIEAKVEEKNDNGFISKQLMRRFVLPKGHDLKNVVSKLSSDGVLTITAPKHPEAEEKVIPISHESSDKTEKIESK